MSKQGRWKHDTIEMPDGQISIYRVPILSLRDYSIEEILEKNLLILLPYYMINYEKKLSEIALDESKTKKLLNEYKMIIEKLELLTKHDNSGVFQDVVKMMQRVIRYLMRKEPKLKERMEVVMGGKVLSLPSDKLREERAAGISQGINRGINQTIRALIDTCREFGETKEEIIERIAKKFSMTEEEAGALVEEHWK